MTLDGFALWLGYAVMVAGGIGVVGLLLCLAVEATWSWAANAYGVLEMIEATRAAKRAKATEK